MTSAYCKQDISLTDEEKAVFAGHLEREALSNNIWDLFEEWAARSTPGVGFPYLKAYRGDELIGLGLFLRVKPVDLRTSYSKLRSNRFLSGLFSVISTLSNNCA